LIAEILLGGLLPVYLWQLAIQSVELEERLKLYSQAKEYARARGKPILIIGRPKGKHPCGELSEGDICLDIDPKVCEECPNCFVGNAEQLSLYFPRKYFACTVFMHSLEHMDNPIQALTEAEYVSDRIYIAAPRKSSIPAIIHPDHKWWVWVEGNDVYLQSRRGKGNWVYRLGEKY